MVPFRYRLEGMKELEQHVLSSLARKAFRRSITGYQHCEKQWRIPRFLEVFLDCWVGFEVFRETGEFHGCLRKWFEGRRRACFYHFAELREKVYVCPHSAHKTIGNPLLYRSYERDV